MGVIYKLKPEVRDFILEQKKKAPSLSCRKLSILIQENFKAEVSKSSINIIIKESGLSAPVGRTPKKKRQRISMPALPVLLVDASQKEAEVKEKEAGRLEEEKWRKKAEEERLAQEEAAKKAEGEKRIQQEAERKAEEERKALQDAQEKARLEAEEKARQEAARLAEEEEKRAEEERLKEEAAKKAKAEEERLAQEEAAKKAEEEKRIQQEAERKAEEERKALQDAQEKERIRAQEKAREEAERQREQEREKLVTQFQAERFQQIYNSGSALLCCADYLIGGSQRIAAVIQEKTNKGAGSLQGVIENLIYLPLLQDKIEQSSLDRISGYLEELEQVKLISIDISAAINSSLQEVRCVKALLSDGMPLYLDGAMYSVWSSPHVPYDFSSPIHKLKRDMEKCFSQGSPLVFFNAPGYDMPSQEFFNLLIALEGRPKSLDSLVLYGNKFEEIEALPVRQPKKIPAVFAIWPWQFTSCRKIRNIGEFRSMRLDSRAKEIYIADIELELIHTGLGRQISLCGCAVKGGLNEKARLVILSNFASGQISSEELSAIYLERWPNMEEGFQDFSRKIELFTYTANSQRFFSTEKAPAASQEPSKIRGALGSYLSSLDAFVRWHLLPLGYEDKDFNAAKEAFYSLPGKLSPGEGRCSVSLNPAENYPFAKELGYACRRANERGVVTPEGLKFYLGLP